MLVQRRSWDQPERGRRSWPGLRSRPRGVSRHEDFRCGRAVAEGRVRPHRIVVAAPALDQDLGLPERVEDLDAEQLVPELAIEAFHVAVLPKAALLDVSRLGANGGDPVLDRRGNELRTLVRADVLMRSAARTDMRLSSASKTSL
jgi:hypothetical protein